jgi:hypothetical protein
MSHFGRELDLILNGNKAMAAFCRLTSEYFDETGGQNFDHYVKTGEIKRSRFFVKGHDGRSLVYTVFYKPSDKWRYNLYRELKKSIHDGWNRDKEIIESILLGYDLKGIEDYITLLRDLA